MTTCLGLAFEAQLQCWAELDRHLTEDIVPWVPLLEASHYTLLSERVSGFSVDQSPSEPVAALDQIAVTGEAPAASPAPQPEAFPDIPPGSTGRASRRPRSVAPASRWELVRTS